MFLGTLAYNLQLAQVCRCLYAVSSGVVIDSFISQHGATSVVRFGKAVIVSLPLIHVSSVS